jgi:hypothetical protein
MFAAAAAFSRCGNRVHRNGRARFDGGPPARSFGARGYLRGYQGNHRALVRAVEDVLKAAGVSKLMRATFPSGPAYIKVGPKLRHRLAKRWETS